MRDKKSESKPRWATNPNIAAETWDGEDVYSPTGGSDQDREEDETLNMRACSARECTGLIPSLPQSDSQLESYAEVYHYPADVFRD